MTLHMQLQRVGQLVVLVEQSLANLRNPLARTGILVAVNGLARPQRDVVQEQLVAVGTAIDQCSHLSVADGQ